MFLQGREIYIGLGGFSIMGGGGGGGGKASEANFNTYGGMLQNVHACMLAHPPPQASVCPPVCHKIVTSL